MMATTLRAIGSLILFGAVPLIMSYVARSPALFLGVWVGGTIIVGSIAAYLDA